MRARFDAALDALRTAGARIDDVEHPACRSHRADLPAHLLGRRGGLPRAHLEDGRTATRRRCGMRLEMGRYVLAEDYVRALAGRDVLRREVDAALSGHDALVLPTLPIPAPPIGANTVQVHPHDALSLLAEHELDDPGVLVQRAADSVAKPDGVTSSSSTVRPSALDTIFDVTTTTSPSTISVAPAMRAARSSPGLISGSPSTPSMCTRRTVIVETPAYAPDVPVSDLFDEEAWQSVEGFDFTDITYHRAVDQGTVRIAFDRPEVRNAFRPQTVDELLAALEHARLSTDVGCVLLTGNGPRRGRRLGVLLRRRPADPRQGRLQVRGRPTTPRRIEAGGRGGCTSSRCSG